MCSVQCPQDWLLFAKIEVIKIETCKIWPISASAQLLRAAGLTVPFCIMKQPTFKKLAHWKVQPSSLNRAKKEAISKILFSQYCHQAWIKWDQYRREWTSGWTSPDTCVWYTQVENCLKYKRIIVRTSYSPLTDLDTKKISPFWTGCPCRQRENWAGCSRAAVS